MPLQLQKHLIPIAGLDVAHPGTAAAAARAPPPPPESSPYLPVSNSQDRRRDTDVLKCSRGPGGTALQSICKETWGAATSIALPASNPIAVRLQPIPGCRDVVTPVSASASQGDTVRRCTSFFTFCAPKSRTIHQLQVVLRLSRNFPFPCHSR